MLCAMRNVLCRKVSQRFWEVAEMCHAHRQNYLSCTKDLAVIQSDGETIGVRLNTHHSLIFQLRHDPFLEGEPIFGERIQANGNAFVAVFNTPLRTEFS